MPKATASVIWTAENSHQASQQGWNVYDCDSEHEIQRNEDSEIFLTNHAAAAYVKGRAALGDALAIKALSMLVSCGTDDVALFSAG
jgi:hypothetical protein